MHKRLSSHGRFGLFLGKIFALLSVVTQDVRGEIGSNFNFNTTFAQEGFSDLPISQGFARKTGSRLVVSLDLDPQNILNSSMRISAREGRLSDLKILLSRGADVDSRAGFGETALMFSARNCSSRVAQFLIRYGADVNARDDEGRTALIHASSGSCLKVVDLLLKVPAISWRARDHRGRSALDYASENAISEVDGPSEVIIRKIEKIQKRNSVRAIRIRTIALSQ